MEPTPEAYDLLHHGSIAFADMEATGVRIDVPKLERTIAKVQEKIKGQEDLLRQDDIYKAWRKRYGQDASIGSRDQLGDVLFNVLGVPYPGEEVRGKRGLLKVDKTALEKLDIPFARRFIRKEELKKVLSTHLRGIQRELVGDRVHAFFNLHSTVTYRPSGDRPNLLNVPVRNKMLARIIRPVFIASEGNQILELDLWSAEVCVAACYHMDPRMLKYLWDSYDFHQQFGMKCFKLTAEQMMKPIRQTAKSYFVFAEFYGDYFGKCAASLWEQISHQKLTTAAGVPLLDHLRECGITKLGTVDKRQTKPGTFVDHIRNVEEDMWENEFPEYAAWRVRWFKRYLKNGEFITHTGFVCRGIMKRNEVVNYPVQGSAFHCLLHVLIELRLWMRKERMKSKIVIQIYDSIVLDAVPGEVPAIVAKTSELYAELHKRWKWIIAPLRTEAELCPVGGSWYDKKGYELPC